MSIEKLPLVAPLIRACKSADKNELKQVLGSIRENGISKKDLNLVDKNGRTALSYICITSHTNVLDFLLRFKGIDVNRPDNDGNTPLHFAAEAGQSDMITMLISRNGSLAIDSKNAFGLTPLMKAAIQGKTDCVKRLMLANASPDPTDPVRGFTAKDWAHFCGRKLCYDSMGELMRKRKAAQMLSAAYHQRKDLSNRERTAPKSLIPNKLYSNQQKDADTTFATKLRCTFSRPKPYSDNDSSEVMHNKIVKVEPNNDLIIKSAETMKQVPIINVAFVNVLEDGTHSIILESNETMNQVPIVKIAPANNRQSINRRKSCN